jgi:hypothetical protein
VQGGAGGEQGGSGCVCKEEWEVICKEVMWARRTRW